MMDLHNAVRSAYPNAAFVRGNDVDSLIAETVNFEPIEIVPSIVTAKLAELQQAQTAAEQAAAAHKASAVSKLSALGLSADEINALIG